MSYIGKDPESYEGKVVGNGQCVAFVRACAGAPASSTWTKGKVVKTSDVAKHTAIATFDDQGNYPNNPTGQHAAIFISKEGRMTAFEVQSWINQKLSMRRISFSRTALCHNST